MHPDSLRLSLILPPLHRTSTTQNDELNRLFLSTSFTQPILIFSLLSTATYNRFISTIRMQTHNGLSLLSVVSSLLLPTLVSLTRANLFNHKFKVELKAIRCSGIYMCPACFASTVCAFILLGVDGCYVPQGYLCARTAGTLLFLVICELFIRKDESTLGQ